MLHPVIEASVSEMAIRMIGNKDYWCNQDYTLSDLPADAPILFAAAADATILFAAAALLFAAATILFDCWCCSRRVWDAYFPNSEEACCIVFKLQRISNIAY